MRVLLITPENRFIKAFRRGQFNNFVQLTMPYLAGFVRPLHHRHNITVQAGIVFGFDGDDESTFEATLRGATRVGLDGATVSILTPFPKTPVFEELQREGRLLTRDWSYYNGKTAVTFQPARMSAKQLWEGYMWFRRRFFAPRCILERVRRSRVRRLQSIILNLGYWRTLVNRIPGRPIPSALYDAEINGRCAPTKQIVRQTLAQTLCGRGDVEGTEAGNA